MTNKEPHITPDHVARMVMLTYGKMFNSQPFWCFVAVKPSRFEEVTQIVAAKILDINNFVKDGYGEIVVSGEGVIPPNEVISKVAAMFNVPVRDLFKDVEVDDIIAKEIERVKRELGNA